jgi:hypothetical protein
VAGMREAAIAGAVGGVVLGLVIAGIRRLTAR